MTAAATSALSPAVAVGVIGAGTMGAGIARVAAEAGHQVLLYDAVDGVVEAALEDLRTRLGRSVDRGRMTAEAATGLVQRITACRSLDQMAGAGLVIEAIVEDLDTKIQVLGKVAAVVGDDAILATNTSSLSVTAIAARIDDPGRVVGMHFFNPAPVMPLVEVVSGTGTSPETADMVFATAAAWGKTPVRCASTPGFIVNRVARPFGGEALRLVAEGVADPATIDAVLTGAGGFRMGPFALMDLVGLDVSLAVSKSVYTQTFHDPRFTPSVIQQALVDAGHLGVKTGRGFYDYTDGAEKPLPATHAPAPRPRAVAVHGGLGQGTGLVPRLEAAGVEVGSVDEPGPGFLSVDGVVVRPTDGRTATRLMVEEVVVGGDIVVFDLVRDWSEADRVAVAVAAQAEHNSLASAAGLFQAGGLDVSVVADSPGLVMMRIVAQLSSVAADAVTLSVAEPGAIDTAMRLGTNYPVGPLEWADQIGARAVVAALDHIRDHYGEDRYRVASLLRQSSLTGVPLRPVEMLPERT